MLRIPVTIINIGAKTVAGKVACPNISCPMML